MIDLIPKNDHDQALRIRRFLMAFSAYILWILLTIYCYYLGLFRLSLSYIILICCLVLIMNLVLYIIFRTGINKRFLDRSLTMQQMLLGTIWIMILAYYMDEARGIMLLIYLVIFIFGVFRLQIRQFVILALYALFGYGYVIVLLLSYRPESIDLQIETLYLLVLAANLFWFSIIGSYINHLRQTLIKTNIDLNEAMKTIKQIAIHDELTNAYNRHHMIDVLQREKSLADRGKPTFTLCIFDLDNFKSVNDMYGHLKGDTVLKTIVGEIKNNIRQQDYIARYGGEEFVLILAYPDINDALNCASRLKDIASTLSYDDLPEDFRATISIGVSQYRPNEPLDTLIARADSALYRAKVLGKNRIECFETRQEKTRNPSDIN